MNNENNDAIEIISKMIVFALKEFNETIKFDKTINGRVIQNLGNGLYKIVINNQEYNVKSETGRNGISINSIVKVVVPQNDFDEMFIY